MAYFGCINKSNGKIIHQYSTTPQKVGVWINGSDVYEVCVNDQISDYDLINTYNISSIIDEQKYGSGYNVLTYVGLVIDSDGYVADFDFTESLEDSLNSFLCAHIIDSSTNNITIDNNGININSVGKNIVSIPERLRPVYNVVGYRYEFFVSNMSKSFTSSNHGRLITIRASDSGIIWRSNGYWSYYDRSWYGSVQTFTDPNYFENSKIVLEILADGTTNIYKDDSFMYSGHIASDYFKLTNPTIPVLAIGSTSGDNYCNCTINRLKIKPIFPQS